MTRGSHAVGRHAAEPPVHTGFGDEVKLVIRIRAGHGNADIAMCECCGTHVGRHGGEVLRIVARGTGTTPRYVMDSAANGALLCGSAADWDGCYGAVMRREPEMEMKGFFVRGEADPRFEPMMLPDPDKPGPYLWRSEDGQYLAREPARPYQEPAEPAPRYQAAHRRKGTRR